MISIIAFLLLFVVIGALSGLFKGKNYLDADEELNSKFLLKAVSVFLLCVVLAWFQPVSVQRIDAGNVGLAIDRIGNDKGIPKVRDVKGWVFYNSWTTDVVEYSIRQEHVDYNKFDVPAKGGTVLPVAPSFNISLKPEAAKDVYIHLTKNEDVIESIKNGWLANATNIAMTNATNGFSPDSIFNNADHYRAEVEKQLNKQLFKYFMVEQIKPGQQPPASMVGILQAKANAVQAQQQAELNRQTAVATAAAKIAEARGDSAKQVIEALADAKTILLKREQITSEYIEYIKWSKWNGALPSTILSNASPLMQLK